MSCFPDSGHKSITKRKIVMIKQSWPTSENTKSLGRTVMRRGNSFDDSLSVRSVVGVSSLHIPTAGHILSAVGS